MEAVPWFDDALACAEAHFGPQSETVKTVREDFVHVLLDAGAQTQSRGDTANAENCYNRATSLAHALPDEVLEATAMTNLGLMQRKTQPRNSSVAERICTG